MSLFGQIVCTVLLVGGAATGTAHSQEAAERYAKAFKLSGFLLRESAVCGDRKAADDAMRNISGPELLALQRAFPQTAEGWMKEGAGLFNSAVMNLGVSKMCAHR